MASDIGARRSRAAGGSRGADVRHTADVLGRFAPSPTGALHVGNLRTALAACASARANGGSFVIRLEDLDPLTSSADHERAQLDDLRALGITSDLPVVRQSDRFDRYRAAIATLERRGLVYPCYCTRREIREAAAAPHDGPLPDGAYPGTCRTLSEVRRRELEAAGRRPALRLRTDGEVYAVDDLVRGRFQGGVDDVVLQRGDGVPAYNLAVVVDDAAQGVTEVVRGEDLLTSTPRQVHLQRLLGLPTPAYGHVPLVVGADGERLAKRHGAVTLRDWIAGGRTPAELLALLARSLGCTLPETAGRPTLRDVAAAFSWSSVPRAPWTFTP